MEFIYLTPMKTGEFLLIYINKIEVINVDTPQNLLSIELKGEQMNNKVEQPLMHQRTGDLWCVNRGRGRIEIRPEFLKLSRF